jgi:hypothetical protein
LETSKVPPGPGGFHSRSAAAQPIGDLVEQLRRARAGRVVRRARRQVVGREEALARERRQQFGLHRCHDEAIGPRDTGD